MRPDLASENTQNTQHRPSTNGSSHHGSSPHTNGSIKSETNGYQTHGHVDTRSELSTVVRNTEPFHGHDREELTRLLLQSLSDLGYTGAAQQLSRESGYELEVPSVAAFRSAVLSGDWEEAEAFLFGVASEELDGGGVRIGNGHGSRPWLKHESDGLSLVRRPGQARNGLPLAEGANTHWLKFLLRQQKYLELLERRDINAALDVLRTGLTPLKTDVPRLHFLSSLVMCPSDSDLRSHAEWDGVRGQSRNLLLSEISKSISPSVMIPEHRLATLLSVVQDERVLDCQYHNTTAQPSLYTDHTCSSDDFPLHSHIELRNHSDEVWHLDFSHDGSMLATAGKDGLVCVYDTVRWRLKHEFREHERSAHTSDSAAPAATADNRGVCFVAFSPNDQYLISCGQNNEFIVVDVRTGSKVAVADHFEYPVTTAAWLPDSETFVVGTQCSQRPLGLYCLRSMSGGPSSGSAPVRNHEIYSWRDPPWDPALRDHQPNSFRVTDCAVNTQGTRMVATTIDSRIMLFSLEPSALYLKIGEWVLEDKLTSINFSSDGELMLVNMNEGRVLALDSETGEVVCRYEGAVQREFVIRSAFGGAGQGCVISGSEDSRVYIWRRQNGMQVVALDAHHPGTVNAVAWHPTNPAVFASAGDDRKVKIWTSASAGRGGPDSSEASVNVSRSLSVGSQSYSGAR